jgi:XTP/dITP diphosphohydrolase
MKFVIATHNQHKVEEFRRILEPMGIQAVTAQLSEAEETGESFMENSLLKAESACRETGLPCIADDSGLCVDALGGEPGIFSARYAPEGERKKTVLRKMEGLPMEKRGAHFVSAICCVFPNGDKIQAEGKCYGKIAFAPRGENGFGYDPIFLCGEKTFAELSGEEKDKISHRGVALVEFEKKLRAYLQK